MRSLWLYGDNDSVWTPALVSQMHDAYVAHGTQAQFTISAAKGTMRTG
ncbi:hypothetical protein [Burkholderia multivorans]